MSMLSGRTAAELGRRLHGEGFLPLPDVDEDGELIGTRLWRVRGRCVEWIALRPSGLAFALRAEAAFDYRRPIDHGQVIEYRSSHAVNALEWLLSTAEAPATRLRRSYVQPDIGKPGHSQRADDEW